MNFSKIKCVAIDADDTLWINEPFYLQTEQNFKQLIAKYASLETISEQLLKTEIKNIELYGFGAKGFTLSMIETAVDLSNNQVTADEILQIIDLGKTLIQMPIELLPDVKKSIQFLKTKYSLVIATKGDLSDQLRKFHHSGLQSIVETIEVMNDKKHENYIELLRKLKVQPNEFLMIGNSMKSDILPILEIGGNAVHIPFHTNWEYEKSELHNNHNGHYLKFEAINDLINHIISNY